MRHIAVHRFKVCTPCGNYIHLGKLERPNPVLTLESWFIFYLHMELTSRFTTSIWVNYNVSCNRQRAGVSQGRASDSQAPGKEQIRTTEPWRCVPHSFFALLCPYCKEVQCNKLWTPSQWAACETTLGNADGCKRCNVMPGADQLRLMESIEWAYVVYRRTSLSIQLQCPCEACSCHASRRQGTASWLVPQQCWDSAPMRRENHRAALHDFGPGVLPGVT